MLPGSFSATTAHRGRLGPRGALTRLGGCSRRQQQVSSRRFRDLAGVAAVQLQVFSLTWDLTRFQTRYFGCFRACKRYVPDLSSKVHSNHSYGYHLWDASRWHRSCGMRKDKRYIAAQVVTDLRMKTAFLVEGYSMMLQVVWSALAEFSKRRQQDLSRRLRSFPKQVLKDDFKC